MLSHRFSDALLDDLRGAGDPLADHVVQELFARGQVGAANRLLRDLLASGGAFPAEASPIVRSFLERSASDSRADPEKLRRAEAVFALHGPAILAVLGLCALPAAYAARKGVEVLHRTSYLLDQPVRRTLETAHILVDVLSPGGLEPGGKGVLAAQKVRLVHAAVRHLARRDTKRPWDASLGVPINQEDMAGTLMTFSYVVIDGLSRLGIRLGEADREAYLHAWVVAGRILGVDERLLPADMREAKALTTLIQKRQLAPSAAGRALTASLLRAFDEISPVPARRFVTGAMRFFLGPEAVGDDVAGMLGLPEERWATSLVAAASRLIAVGHRVAGDAPVVQSLLRLASRRFVQAMLAKSRYPRRAPFTIPDTLRAASGARASASRCPLHRALGLAAKPARVIAEPVLAAA